MYKIFLPFLILSSITIIYADSAIQTDWSGVPGVWGPVTSFNTDFYFDSGVACYSGSGNITLEMIDNVVPHNVAWNLNGPKSVYSEDIDGDGDMDIIGSVFSDNDVIWWENINGYGIEWNEHIIDDNFHWAEAICSKDIDGDGDMDVLGAGHDDDGLVWWENMDGTGTIWTAHIIEWNYDAYDVNSEDIDNDGDLDVISANMYLNEITWWENEDGTGTVWIKHIIDDSLLGHSVVYSEDIDGDGDMDVIGNWGSSVDWWENVTGLGTIWLHHTVGNNFENPYCVHAEDIDGDGNMDILGAADQAVSDDISWWENADGTGTSWVKHIVHGYFFLGASAVHSADMDNDGDMDILAAAYYDANIDWFENLDGYGTSWEMHTVAGSFAGARSIYPADINGDGIMDVIGAAALGEEIAWWDALTYPPEGFLMSSVLDTECSPIWSDIDWSASQPSGTSVGFQVRSSDDPDSTAMGSWSDTLYSPCSLAGILTDGEQYVQYRTIFETTNPDITPLLSDITINWNPFGIQGEPGPESLELLPFHPNPTTGSSVISFTVPELSSVELFIFDISGRLIESVPTAEYSTGYHSIVISDLSPGIYFCRMMSSDFNVTQRLVVIE